VPVVIPIDNTTPPTDSVIATGAPISGLPAEAIACSDLSCDGDFAVSGAVNCNTLAVATASVTNAMIVASAGISGNKVVHQNPGSSTANSITSHRRLRSKRRG
jgi:hypothetical protein